MFHIDSLEVAARAFEDRFSGFGGDRDQSDLEAQIKSKISADVFEMLRVTAEGGTLKSSHLDENGRLHNPSGPAVEFYDYEPKKWYFLHGLEVPEKLIERPEELTKADFINENNAEIRRIMVEHVGSDKFSEIQDLEKISTGELNGQKVELLRSKESDDLASSKIQFVRVTCNSTGRVYNLGVPPTFEDALEALAWTFNMSKEEYQPKVET